MGTKEVSERKCSTVTSRKCNQVPKQVCEDVSTPREVCNDIPDEVCRSVPATITRQECENIKENVPRQTFEERCNTEYVEECTSAPAPAPAAHSRPMIDLMDNIFGH